MASPGSFTAAVLDASELNALEALTSWTPSWTNVTVGNGTVVAKYAFVQKRMTGHVKFTLGSTSAIASGAPRVSLPSGFTIDTVTQFEAVGPAYFLDAGTTNALGYCRVFSSTAVDVVLLNASGTYAAYSDLAATTPWTWTTNDVITFTFTVLGSF